MRNNLAHDGLSGGLFLIGLGLILLLPGFGIWPWILAVIGISQLPTNLARKRGWYGWQSCFWLVGLAILFATGFFWPGILIAIGMSMLLGALTREDESSPFAGATRAESRAATREPAPSGLPDTQPPVAPRDTARLSDPPAEQE
jgi:hypothetical protein